MKQKLFIPQKEIISETTIWKRKDPEIIIKKTLWRRFINWIKKKLINRPPKTAKKTKREKANWG